MTLVNLNGRPAPKTVNYFLDQLLNDFQGSPSKDASVHAPVNITDTPNAYQLELSVPGRNKEDFKLNIENGLLTISYEKKDEEKQEGVKSIRREFSFGSFKRSFTLDKNVDTENISAKYENGILSIGLPKKAEVKPAVQQISVQ
jgi:HSP20 family protein